MRLLFWLVVATSSLALCAAGAYFGQQIPFEKQWPLFEALRTTASIIFAVVGAWLAIIYPERLKLSFGRKAEPAELSGSANVSVILYPVIYSTIILVCVLLIGVLAPILKQVPALMAHREIMRGFSFFLLTALTLWQIAVVVMTLLPADLVKSSVDAERIRASVLARRNSLAQQHQPD